MAMPKKKKKGEDSEDANPVFEISAEEKVFKGDPNDRKALLRHKQHVKACSSCLMAPHAPASSGQPLIQSAALRAFRALRAMDLQLSPCPSWPPTGREVQALLAGPALVPRP